MYTVCTFQTDRFFSKQVFFRPNGFAPGHSIKDHKKLPLANFALRLFPFVFDLAQFLVGVTVFAKCLTSEKKNAKVSTEQLCF